MKKILTIVSLLSITYTANSGNSVVPNQVKVPAISYYCLSDQEISTYILHRLQDDRVTNNQVNEELTAMKKLCEQSKSKEAFAEVVKCEEMKAIIKEQKVNFACTASNPAECFFQVQINDEKYSYLFKLGENGYSECTLKKL